MTAPDGPPQPHYMNAVAHFETTLSPMNVWEVCRNIESLHGRRRDVRWGARTLDLDILMWGSRILESPELTLPHPRMHLRRFVLEPFASISPDAIHPTTELSIQQLLEAIKDGESDISEMVKGRSTMRSQSDPQDDIP